MSRRTATATADPTATATADQGDPTAPTADQGDQGDPTAPTADQGDQGDQGDPTAPTADQGDQGDQGDPTADQGDQGDQGDPTATAPTATAEDIFTEAFNAAIANRDPITGTVPAVHVDAVAKTYRAIRAGARDKIAGTLNAATMAAAMSDPTAPDVSTMMAAGNLAAAIAASGTAPAKQTAPVVDPKDAFRDALAALTAATEIFDAASDLSIDDKNAARDAAAVMFATALDNGTDLPDNVLAMVGNVVRAVTASPKKVRAAGAGTPRAPRTPGAGTRSIAGHIAEVVGAAGAFVSLSDIKKSASSDYASGEASGGAITNRHAADDVLGVTAAEQNGKKGFAPA